MLPASYLVASDYAWGDGTRGPEALAREPARGDHGVTRGDVVRGAVLGITGWILRHVGRRIAARAEGDGAVALAKMAQLRFPAAVIAGEFMHEDERALGKIGRAHV